jgi:hypothetical protein
MLSGMKLTSLAVLAVSAAAAATTGVASYEAFAPGDAPAAAAPSTAADARPNRVVRMADCPRDTVLRGKFCIRTEERTLTEYVAAPPAPAQHAVVAPPTPAGERGSSDDRDDDARDHDADPFYDDHDEDDDDHNEDDHHDEDDDHNEDDDHDEDDHHDEDDDDHDDDDHDGD